MSGDVFWTLYITTLVMVGLIIFLPMILGIFFFSRYKKKEEEQADFYTRIAIRQQQEAERLAQEEIDVKKKKYQRRKCAYCGSLNRLEDSHCVNCGGVLVN